jgi:hypothetical protein
MKTNELSDVCDVEEMREFENHRQYLKNAPLSEREKSKRYVENIPVPLDEYHERR